MISIRFQLSERHVDLTTEIRVVIAGEMTEKGGLWETGKREVSTTEPVHPGLRPHCPGQGKKDCARDADNEQCSSEAESGVRESAAFTALIRKTGCIPPAHSPSRGHHVKSLADLTLSSRAQRIPLLSTAGLEGEKHEPSSRRGTTFFSPTSPCFLAPPHWYAHWRWREVKTRPIFCRGRYRSLELGLPCGTRHEQRMVPIYPRLVSSEMGNGNGCAVSPLG